MQFTRFDSRDPLNHVQRVLGILQRMGFILRSISVNSETGGESARVELRYATAGTLSPDTFAARVSELRGVEGLTQEAIG